jgi:hypothetical protein
VSIEATPPAKPPRVSPDGNWVWDGTKWQPNVAAMPWEGADATVVSEASVAKNAPSPVVQQLLAVTRPYSPPAATPASNYVYPVAEQPVTPLWVEAPRSGKRPYLYFVAGLVLLVITATVLSNLGITQFPWSGSGSTPNSGATPAASLPALAARSDYARADRLLNLTLTPALAAYNQTIPALSVGCYGTLSNACFEAITTTAKQVKKMLGELDRADIPPCIAASMSKVHSDVTTMDTGLQFALKGFGDNMNAELNQGLHQFGLAGQALGTDAQSVDRAQKAQCSKDLTGP